MKQRLLTLRQLSIRNLSQPSRNEFLLNKSYEKVQERFQRGVEWHKQMAQDKKLYFEQQRLLVERLQDPSAIDRLFSSTMKADKSVCILLPEDLQKDLNNGERLTYFSPIQHSILCLASHLVNSLIVEMNLRRQFIVDDPSQKMPTSFFFRENVIDKIQHHEKKTEIFQILQLLKKPVLGTSSSGKDKQFTGINDIVELLDQNEIKRLFQQAKTSDSFSSIEFQRYNFIYYKSGQYLNYDHSDTFKYIQSLKLISFESPVVDDTQILAELEPLFNDYFLHRDTNNLQHLNLTLGIVKVLLGKHKFTPSYTVFKYLLANCDDPELHNLQGIIYDCLWLHEHRQTILASTSKGNRLAYQFKHLVQSQPDFLDSIIRFQVSRGDIATFRELLGFYRLRETIGYEKTLLKTSLTGLVSQSRFTSNRSSMVLPKDIEFGFSPRPLFIEVNTLYSTIEACIKLQQFEYIDLLLSKLVLFSMKNGNQVALSLSSEENEDQHLMIAEELTPSEFSKNIFTKKLFLLLFRACREAKDAGRVLWLIPHLDLYIESNMESSKDHIQRIKRFYRESIVDGNYSNVSEFQDFEDDSCFDTEFIKSVYETLKMFGIDGKVHSYNKYFDFENTISEKVR